MTEQFAVISVFFQLKLRLRIVPLLSHQVVGGEGRLCTAELAFREIEQERPRQSTKFYKFSGNKIKQARYSTRTPIDLGLSS